MWTGGEWSTDPARLRAAWPTTAGYGYQPSADGGMPMLESYDALGAAAEEALAHASRTKPAARWVEVAWAIRQWAVAMGAMPGARGEVIDYAPVPEWVTGLGFVQLFA